MSNKLEIDIEFCGKIAGALKHLINCLKSDMDHLTNLNNEVKSLHALNRSIALLEALELISKSIKLGLYAGQRMGDMRIENESCHPLYVYSDKYESECEHSCEEKTEIKIDEIETIKLSKKQMAMIQKILQGGNNDD